MKQSVYIATPTYDEWVCIEYAASLFESASYLTQSGIGLSHAILPGNPFLDQARNQLVDSFLKSDCTDLLFVDADVGWDAKALTRVLSYKQEIVGGLVPKRDAKRDDSYHQNALNGKWEDGLFGCIELPTAFMRIKRSAFDRLAAMGVGTDDKPWFKIGSKKEDFGEDIYFCRRWCETGQILWIDSDINFSHRGSKAWKGNFYDHAVKTGMLVRNSATSMAA